MARVESDLHRDLCAVVLRGVRGRKPVVSRATAAFMASEIEFHIGEYWRRQGKDERNAALVSWLEDGFKHFQALKAWNGRRPADAPAYDVSSLLDKLEALFWRRRFPESRAMRKPSLGWRMLEWEIAYVLEEAGIRPTTAKTGTFALVLELVHANIGLTRRDPHKSVRTALELIAEARAGRTVPVMKK